MENIIATREEAERFLSIQQTYNFGFGYTCGRGTAHDSVFGYGFNCGSGGDNGSSYGYGCPCGCGGDDGSGYGCGCGQQLQLQFNLQPGNFHMPQMQLKKRKKEKKPIYGKFTATIILNNEKLK